MGGIRSTHEEVKNANNIFVGKSERKRPLERYRHRWENNIRTDLGEIGCEFVDCMHVDRDVEHALVNTVINFRIP